MAYLTQPDYVKYKCSCGQLKPITSLYFCRHCLKIRCGFCICHEVDSHYCAYCLENMPSSEARLKKNRCSSCFDCPSCFHTLSTRATLAQPRQDPAAGAGGDGKVGDGKQAKRVYYLSCFNCRWTARDVGIPDQPVASGGWPERTSPHATRVNQLLDYYKAVLQQEKQEKIERERKKFAVRGKYITLTDKTGLTGAMARSIAGLPPAEGSSLALAGFTPAVASEEVDELPEDAFTKDVNLNQITSMPQRLAAPEWQPTQVSRLHPIAKLLSVKRSQRCRACDHNLTKPEYNPGSIKFKIELLAYYHVPEVKIISCEIVRPGGKSTLLLKLANPTPHEMTLRILQPSEIPAEEEKESDKDTSLEKSLDKSLKIEKQEPSWNPKEPPAVLTHITPPAVTLALAPRDDAAEYDDDARHEPSHIILWRKSNKLALRLELATDATAAEGCAAQTALALEYSYRNTVPQPGAPQNRDHTLYTTLYLDLGTVGAAGL
ncbi:LOW QUALITY PROTEIN: dynactin subunit 4 [Leguminivora glycinivorella]|uniref:LOW QUALITY PROTEIN: dynactin subunit 4 n=1 Tax=Leguminivora glycinivorella TaxID=1035111 RepID=UPI00200E8EA1|nr:LOW QUALITY PROTEIN: dynactin subunit 4 [Leguminivora glycinivorella]